MSVAVIGVGKSWCPLPLNPVYRKCGTSTRLAALQCGECSNRCVAAVCKMPSMAANQRNTNLFHYVDDSGTGWSARGEIDTAVNALDGSSALVAGNPVWIDSARRQTRKAVFFDPATFRTKRVVVFTAAAYAAITGATTLAVNVPGETATVTYSLSQKIPERQPIGKTSRNLPDHP